MEYTYCPYCGDRLTETWMDIEEMNRPACPKGHFVYYPSLIGAAAIIVHHNGAVLLEKRAIEPGYGKWNLLGGYLIPGESVEEGAAREVFEESGLHVQLGKPFKTWAGSRTLAVYFDAVIVGGELRGSKESLDVRFFNFNEIPWDEIAFIHHKDTLKQWIEKNS